MIAVGAASVRPRRAFDVLDYGADPTGKRDSTDAVLNALFDCIGSPGFNRNGPPDRQADAEHAAKVGRLARGKIVLPAGVLRVSAPTPGEDAIPVLAAYCLSIEGVGLATQIWPVGEMRNVLGLLGCKNSAAENLRFEGLTATPSVSAEAVHGAAVAVWTDTAVVAQQSSNVDLTNLMVDNLRCGVGVRIGNNAVGNLRNQNDNNTLTRIRLAAPQGDGTHDAEWWRAGVWVGDGQFDNNLVHNCYQLFSAGWTDGYRADGTDGAVYGGGFGNNANDLHLRGQGYFHFSGFRSESSGRLLLVDGIGTAPTVVNLSDVEFMAGGLNADGFLVNSSANGSIRLVHVFTNVVDTPPKLRVNSQNGAGLLIDGCSFPTPLDDLIAACRPTGFSTYGIPLALTPSAPPATTLVKALRFYLLASLPGLTECYRRETGGRPVYPYCVLNVVGESPDWNDSGADYPGWCEVQFTFVSDDADAAELLRDTAYRLFTPRRKVTLAADTPGFAFDDGAVPKFGCLPGRRWELRQPGKGGGGKPAWLFTFQTRFLVTRLM